MQLHTYILLNGLVTYALLIPREMVWKNVTRNIYKRISFSFN